MKTISLLIAMSFISLGQAVPDEIKVGPVMTNQAQRDAAAAACVSGQALPEAARIAALAASGINETIFVSACTRISAADPDAMRRAHLKLDPPVPSAARVEPAPAPDTTQAALPGTDQYERDHGRTPIGDLHAAPAKKESRWSKYKRSVKEHQAYCQSLDDKPVGQLTTDELNYMHYWCPGGAPPR